LLPLLLFWANFGTAAAVDVEKDWFKKTRIYSMVALPAEDAARFHITVNGLWNGYIGAISSPFAFGRLLESLYSGNVYASDKEFVDTLHGLGQIVPGTILTSQGHATTQGDRLTLSSISGYELLVVPAAEGITANQKNLIDHFVQNGGKAIIFDP